MIMDGIEKNNMLDFLLERFKIEVISLTNLVCMHICSIYFEGSTLTEEQRVIDE